MNKKFLKTAAVTMGLTVMSVPFTACNMRPNDVNPQRTGIIDRQNTTQYGSPMRYSNNGYQGLDNTRLNNAGRTINTPMPRNGIMNGNLNGNVNGNLNNTAPLPGTMGTTPGANAGNVNDMRSKSQNIERQVETLTNVKDANVMVVGNTALVACSPNTTAVDTNAMRTDITQKVKSIDPSITNVVVTESADMMTNINQMFSNMNNKSMNQITQDFNNMLRQITPSMS